MYSESEVSAKISTAVAQAISDAEEKLTRTKHERDALSNLCQQINAQNAKDAQALWKEMEQVEKKYTEREAELKQSIIDSVTGLYQKQISALQIQLVQEEKGHKKQLQSLHDEHASEIDDLIRRLDEFLAEQDQRDHEKETIISVLSSQLVEAKALASNLEYEKGTLEKQINQLKDEVASCRPEISSLQRRLEIMKADHAQAMEHELIKRRKAVQLATQDIRAAAEVQFDEANKHYLRLKQDCDDARAELKRTKQQHERAMKDVKANEVAVSSNIAKLKADLATADARVAEMVKQYSAEREGMLLAERALRSQLEEAQTNCSAAHASLAHVVRENQELRKISEELMAIVEGKQLSITESRSAT